MHDRLWRRGARWGTRVVVDVGSDEIIVGMNRFNPKRANLELSGIVAKWGSIMESIEHGVNSRWGGLLGESTNEWWWFVDVAVVAGVGLVVDDNNDWGNAGFEDVTVEGLEMAWISVAIAVEVDWNVVEGDPRW